MSRILLKRPKRIKFKAKFGLFLIILGCLILALSLDHTIRPILLQHAQARAQIFANTIINQTVKRLLKEENLTYDQIVRVTRNADQSIASVQIDSVCVNTLKAELIGRAQKEISAAQPITVGIPMGTLSGVDYLLGRGPELRFSLKMSAALTAALKSSFTSAGINQTLHRITLQIHAKLYLVMPLYRSGCEAANDFLIAETVIVGKIPDAYTNVVETPSDDIAGVLFDYSASTS